MHLQKTAEIGLHHLATFGLTENVAIKLNRQLVADYYCHDICTNGANDLHRGRDPRTGEVVNNNNSKKPNRPPKTIIPLIFFFLSRVGILMVLS